MHLVKLVLEFYSISSTQTVTPQTMLLFVLFNYVQFETTANEPNKHILMFYEY